MVALSIIGVIALLILVFIFLYNGLVRGRNGVEEAWSGISVQLKRRHDLIPALVSVVKGYASHESSTLEKVIAARSAATNAMEKGPQGIGESMKAESGLTQALRSVFAIAENYPDLKASANFTQLQTQLSEIENELQMARRYYNGTARDQNNRVQTIPTNIIASIAKFTTHEYFELDDPSEAQMPKVEF